MRAEKIDRDLWEHLQNTGEAQSSIRVIVKLVGVLDPGRVNFLRGLGADGALDETVYLSTRLTKNAILRLSDEDWVRSIEAPADQTYHPDPPKWLGW